MGYRRYCVEIAEVVRGKIDVDEDGILDDAAYYVEAIVPYSSSDLEFLSLGGVRITWRRPVSPTADSPDVRRRSGLASLLSVHRGARGVRNHRGCGDGSNYCPDAALTRGQMAVFLAKALGLHWVD